MEVIANAVEGVVDGPGEQGDTVWVETIACEGRREKEGAAQSNDDRGFLHLGLRD